MTDRKPLLVQLVSSAYIIEFKIMSPPLSLSLSRSTSEPNVGKEIRKHIRSPYFIPPTLNNADLAWIFMGAPGPGASIHVRYCMCDVRLCEM